MTADHGFDGGGSSSARLLPMRQLRAEIRRHQAEVTSFLGAAVVVTSGAEEIMAERQSAKLAAEKFDVPFKDGRKRVVTVTKLTQEQALNPLAKRWPVNRRQSPSRPDAVHGARLKNAIMHREHRHMRSAPTPSCTKQTGRLLALRDVAVVAIDGLVLLENRPFPREVALAFVGEHRTLAWLVQPEALWDQPTKERGVEPAGAGLHPAFVACELAAACEGYRVYSELHLAAAAWLRRLFAVAGLSTSMPIRDLRNLLVPLCKHLGEKSTASVRRAEAETGRLYPGSERAAREAAGHVHFVKLLATQA